MDVLQVIKDEHNRLRQLVVELSEVKTQKQRKVLFDQVEFHLLSHLRIEEEFVYPEAEDCLLPVPESFFNISLENHKLLRKTIKALKKVVDAGSEACKKSKYFSALGQQVANHFELEESILMPRMRKGLPTQEREDLGLVYRDMIADFPEIATSPKRRSQQKKAQ